MKNLQRNLARLAGAATASALLVVLPASVANAGAAACVGKANVGGTEITQNTTTNSTLTHDLPSTLDVNSPAQTVNVVSNSSIDKDASATAWSIGGRSVKGSTEASVVIGSDPTPISLPLDIPGVNMTQGQPTYLKAYGSFRFTPPSTPQVVVFKTPDRNFNAVTKFYEGPLGTGNLKIDVQAVCDPAGEDTIGTPVRVMAQSTTTLAAIEGPLTANSSTQVPVSVTVSGGVVSGKARLVIDDTDVRPLRSLVNGQTQLALDGLSEGTHTVKAEFVPNDPTLYRGSVSPVQTLNVAPPAVATTTALSLAKSTVSSSEPVLATATVSAASGTPSGNVIFAVDGKDALTRPLSAGSTSVQGSLTGLSVGARDIQARFVPTSPLQYAASTSAIATVVVRAPSTPTTTTVSLEKNPASTSDLIVATATVTAASGTVAGNVRFFIDGIAAGGATPVAGGSATRTLGRVATPGERVVTAEFTPTNPADFETSSGETTLVVTAPGNPTTTTMSVTPTSGTSADSLVARVTVARSGGTPAGSVDIQVDGTKVASGALDASGAATVALPSLDSGTRAVRAVFVPTSPLVDQASQSTTQQVTITAVTSSTTLTVDPDTASAGMDVTARARVTTSAGTPKGTVDFFVDNVRRASAPVGVDGSASAVLPALDQGTYEITATFVPTQAGQQVASTSSPTTLTLTQPVQAAATTTTATVAEPTVTVDDHGKVSVVVDAANATPRGRIDIQVGGETVSAPLVDGAATVSLPLLSTGQYTFVAAFVPANAQIFEPSQSAQLTLRVVRSAATTTTRLSLSPATATAGEEITATASVSTSRGTPAGGVAFTVDGGPESVVALSGLTAVLELSDLVTGAHTVTARFVPDNRLDFSASSAPDRTVTVLATPGVSTATGLAIAPSSVHENETATATVTVTSAVGPAAGTVEVVVTDADGFRETVTSTLAAGSGTVSLPTYQSGTFEVRASYVPGADTLFDPSTSAVRELTVTSRPLDAMQTHTSVVLSPATVVSGESATARASIVWAGGAPSGAVEFFANNQSVGDAVTVARGSAKITLPTDLPGSYSITARFVPDDPAVMSASSSQDPMVLRVNRPAPVRTMTVVRLDPAKIVDGEVSVASARVTTESGTAQGEVVFSVDGIETKVSLTGDTATLPLTNYDRGDYLVAASFVPAQALDFVASTSGTAALTVTAPPPVDSDTSTSLTLSSTNVFVDELVSAQVAVSSTGQGFPEGQALVTAGGATFRAPLVDGTATLSLPALVVGTHAVKAVFEPAAGAPFTSSSAVDQTIVVRARPVLTPVQPTATTTTLSLDTSVGHLGSNVTVSAKVTGASGGAVRISTGWKTVTAPLVNGVATATVQLTAMGTSHITATYVPANAATAPSIATTTIKVTKALTRVKLKGKFTKARHSINVTGAVTADGGLTFCTGRTRVTVLADGKRALKVQVPMNCSGKMRRLFTDLPRAKKYTVIAAYRGSSTTEPTTKKITVKGARR